jgi:hypothetical protein
MYAKWNQFQLLSVPRSEKAAILRLDAAESVCVFIVAWLTSIYLVVLTR